MFYIYRRDGENIRCLSDGHDSLDDARAYALTLDYAPNDLWIYDSYSEMKEFIIAR